MTVLFYIALAYLSLTTAILLLNKGDFQPLQPVPDGYFDRQAPSVSICIPARNEADCIERCVRSAVVQNYPSVHVYVLDDGSTDGTDKVIMNLENEFPDRLTILNGRPKPNDWLGKPWACQQLSNASNGDILLFIDADTWLKPDAVAKTVRTMGRDVLDFITLWPSQKLGTFWEKNVIPIIYQTMLTHLPVRYVRRPPRWIPPFLRKKTAPFFAAACGQFMAFKRNAYEHIGGHRSVKNAIVEDVALAKNIKKAGFTMNMYHGRQTVACRMYRSHQRLWEGLRKNFLAGFNYNISLFIAAAMLNAIAYLMPAAALPFLIIAEANISLLALCTIALLLMLVQRYIINRWFNWNIFFTFLHPTGIAWFHFLGIRVITDYIKEIPPRWKGREL